MNKPVLSIASYLETLEDTKFSKKSHTMGLMGLNVILQEKDSNVTPQEVRRILAVFEKCMKEDLILMPHGLTAVLSLLTNEKVIQNLPTQDLLPSALAVLNMLQSMSVFKVTENLRFMAMQVFLTYPTEVLSIIIKHHCAKVIKIFEVFKRQDYQPLQELNKSAYYILKGLLTKLPVDEKKMFLEEGIPIWFNDLIPLIMSSNTVESVHYVSYLELLESLEEALTTVDYFKSPVWKHDFLKNVCELDKYPMFLKRQLINNSTIWHRLWIVLVKLLKTQVTRSCPYGTPIQSILGVVESAFKMDAHKVCVLQCWDTLIDILSTDNTPNCVRRYIKLLLIPMKVNNAKTEPTVRAKFNTWWKLIQKFQSNLGEFTDEVVITFIQFAFGKRDQTKNSSNALVACQLKTVNQLCLQAFVQIVGHDDSCNCCRDLPKLTNKFLNNKLLISHWGDWMHALRRAIITTDELLRNNEDSVADEFMQVLCVWNAFVKSIAELPPNGVRRDLFNELLNVLSGLIENQWATDTLSNIMFSLILTLTENDEGIRNMVINCVGLDDPIHKIIAIVLHKNMEGLYKRYGTEKMVGMLKPLIDMILASENKEWLINNLTQLSRLSSTAITLWTSLAHSASEIKVETKLMSQILLWAVKASMTLGLHMDQQSSAIWLTLYSTHEHNLCQIAFDVDLFEYITKCDEDLKENNYFKYVVTACLLKHMVTNHQDYALYAQRFELLTKSLTMYKTYEPIIPMLVDTVVLLLHSVSLPKHIDGTVAKVAMNCVDNLFNLIIPEIYYDKSGNKKMMLNNIIKAVKDMHKVSEYTHLTRDFLETKLINMTSVKSTPKVSARSSNKIQDSVETPTTPQNKSKATVVTGSAVKEFTSPNVKVKKSKKEASIVKTVVENGEEYVVVKSNWKFNPKKLTENQKEKLQRKREDIPALYQDLSQSQDEFKLKSWKTDSQDTTMSTSTSNSKSTTISNQNAKEDASNILKNIASFDVVPNIMKNMITENDKTPNTNTEENTEQSVQTDNKTKKVEPVTPKHTKSPRMALKDRVFRNVRNLIEKSSPKNSASEVNAADSQLNDVQKTPPPIENKNSTNLIQSAPSQVSADRPSRMKRKPKKFDDVQLFGLKKRRYSQADSTPNSQIQTEISDIEESGTNKEMTSSKERKRSHDDMDSITNKANAHIENKMSFVPDQMVELTVPLIEIKQDVTDLDVQDHADVLKTEPMAPSELDKAITDETHPVIIVDTLHDDHNLNDLVENNVQNVDIDLDTQNKEQESDNQIVLSENNEDVINENEDQLMNDVQDEHKVSDNKTQESNNKTESNNNNEVDTLNTPHKTKNATEKSSSTGKKYTKKKSRLEKELAIDMVEGHPFLKTQSDKRLTRKKLVETNITGKRKSVPEDTSKTKKLSKVSPKESPKGSPKGSPKTNKKQKESDKPSPNHSQTSAITVEESQERNTPLEDPPCSEDIIESSQDSTFTTISVKSSKRTPRRVPVVTVEKIDNIKQFAGTQDLLPYFENDASQSKSINQDSKEDIEFPQNKTAEVNKDVSQLTENMDTEPVIHEKINDDDNDDDVVIVINEEDTPITVNSDKSIGLETQELAEADTQPNNPADFLDFESTYKPAESQEIPNTALNVTEPMTPNKLVSQDISNTQHNIPKRTIELSVSKINCDESETDVCSPYKDDVERKKDFLNNTSEISPIKVQSPDKEKSPEKQEDTSSDYLVVKLSSPVHSNGEPYHSGSPEFFSEDKISPEKRDQSPPRAETSSASGSPSSSLSLKKNKPQAKRSGGRAAHMLGLLCIPDSLKHSERAEPEEPKKVGTSTPARRNLRVLYNAVGDNTDNNLDEVEQHNFLKLKKALPSVDSSPSVPILKRKLDVADDNTASPAGKRKRVSFHDPPVSTTVSVHKYIEPALNRSPSSSQKRQVTRSLTKSPKRLDTVFKLDTVLCKALESFKEPTDSLSNDTNGSLDITPAVEVVNISELNDTEPICPELVDCKDPIDNIALELSSPAMKDLLIKELDGKVVTIGDLAKMTELEVNRLCIKAPKVQVARKVLADYMTTRIATEDVNIIENKCLEDETAIATEMDEEMMEPKNTTIDTQTDVVEKCDAGAQTTPKIAEMASTQTDNVPKEDCSAQTLESGSRTTSEIVISCLAEKPDFIERLGEIIPSEKLIEVIAKQTDTNLVLGQILDHRNQHTTQDKRTAKELAFFKDFLTRRFGSKDLIRFCSRILDSVHDKIE